MKARIGLRAAALCALMATAAPARAHRLDEYLQATVVDVSRQHITLTLRLTPGVEVAPGVIRQIGGNGDSAPSAAAWQGYGATITRGLSLALNGRALPLRVVATAFPAPAAMRAGNGVMTLRLEAAVALAPGVYHLAYANHNAGPDTVYLVNALLPRDPALHAIRQQRTPDQSSYQLDFTLDR